MPWSRTLNATGPGDRVTVRAAVRDGWAELAVTDTGCGIAAADVEHMFERFVRGPCASDRPGTGLGLPIVKAITEAHGGTVTVTTRPARGSTFRLRIGPACTPGPTAPLPESGEVRLSPGRRGSSAGGRPR